MILSLKRLVSNFYCLYNISFTKIKLIDHIGRVMVRRDCLEFGRSWV